MNKDFRCVICGEKIHGEYGNNPEPVRERGRCCDKCNSEVVIPIRILSIYAPEKYEALIKDW